MEIICKPRGEGKTTELIRKSANEDLYIVCFCRKEAERVAAQAANIGKDIPYPLTADEFIAGKFNSQGIKGFLIDNAEEILRNMAKGVPLVAITLTGEQRRANRREGGV